MTAMTTLTPDDLRRRVAAVLRVPSARNAASAIVELRTMTGQSWARAGVEHEFFTHWHRSRKRSSLALLCYCEPHHFALGPASFQALPLPALDTLRGTDKPGAARDAAIMRLRGRMAALLKLQNPAWRRGSHDVVPYPLDTIAVALRSDEDCQRTLEEWAPKVIVKAPVRGCRPLVFGIPNHKLLTWEDGQGVQRWGVKIDTLKMPRVTQPVKLPSEYLYQVVECYPDGSKLKNEGRLIYHEVSGDRVTLVEST